MVAGPGTGKTFAIMRRVARLLEDGVAPQSLLVLSFTRIAAGDLKKEIEKLQVRGVEHVNATTMHGYCFSLLSRQAVMDVTGRVARPLLAFEEKFLKRDLAVDFGGLRSTRELLESFKAAWADLQSDTPGWPVDEQQLRFQSQLESWLRFHGCMLIGELVVMALSFLRDNPQYASNALVEVVTDEYQDLNKAEQVLIDLIARGARLTIVGDEDQSIYSFKRAHPDGIREFGETHLNTETWELNECRRCPKRVVDIANALIANNTSRKGRTLTKRDLNPDGEVTIVQWGTLSEESRGVARLVKERIDSGFAAPGEILVLSPVRMFGYRIRNELNRIHVPAHSFFSEEALDGNPADLDESLAQQAFTLLTIVAYPDDVVALRSWCGFGSPSLRRGEWARLRQHCNANGVTPNDALNQLLRGDARLANVGGIVERYRLLLERLTQLATLAPQELIDELFPASESWTEVLRTFCPAQITPETDAISIHASMRTSIVQPELPTDVDYVRVMSLHKSKGLTAKMVVVTGCLNGLLPKYRVGAQNAAEQQHSLEEQRRLAYVAITRATHTLILSSAASIPRSIAHTLRVAPRTQASRFIGELGPTAPASVPGQSL